MKPYLLVLCGVVLFVGGMYIARELSVLEVKNVEPEIVEVTPEWAEDEEAVEAAQAVIERKKLEDELGNVNSQIDGLEANLEALKAQRVELEKQIGTY